jgi:hypothetical protein
MAVSTVDTKAVLRSGIGAVQADSLAAWMDAVLDALEAVGAVLDSEAALTGTSIVTTVSAIIDD